MKVLTRQGELRRFPDLIEYCEADLGLSDCAFLQTNGIDLDSYVAPPLPPPPFFVSPDSGSFTGEKTRDKGLANQSGT